MKTEGMYLRIRILNNVKVIEITTVGNGQGEYIINCSDIYIKWLD
ncbi:hypothetical protein ABIC55_001790 [Sporosarcina psychrophila]|uniref:Uncharacterized protein n=1 Tax=Sporosarcina psychrophila TaxID=1476 RepID=A0ABV2K9J5_SPOPS